MDEPLKDSVLFDREEIEGFVELILTSESENSVNEYEEA